MKKRKAKVIKDPKVRGEWVESVFMARAGEQGLAVSKPWGDSASYDFVVGRPGHFVSVQVKSTVAQSGGGYACAIRKQGKAYASGSFDFVAAYVVLEDVWYIIPADKVKGKESVGIGSDSKWAKYETYREAWNLLREAAKAGEEAESAGAPEDVPEDALEHVPKEAWPAAAPAGGALARMEECFKFARQHFERSGIYMPKRDEET